MFASFWSSWFASAASRKSARKLGRRVAARSRFFQHRARVERLEDRALLAADLDLTKTATFAVGGDVNGSGTFNPGDTILYTVTVANVGDVDLTGVTFDDVIDANTTLGQVNVSPLARNDSFNAVGNTLLRVGGSAGTGPEVFVAGGSVLSNDSEFLGDTFTLTTIANGTTALGGTLNLNADGTFTYISQAGDTGTDSFTYTIKDDGFDGIAGNADDLSGTGTVSIVLTGTIWYVNNSGANGNGTSISPFNTLTGAQTASVAGDTIFVHTGSGPYTTGITLKNNQTLWGQGSALTATLPAGTPSGLVTLLAAGTDPTIANAAGNGVTLASGNTLKGFTVGDTTGYDIANTTTATVGTLTITNVDSIGTGGVFRADSGGALTVTLDTATSTSTAAGIHGIQLGGALTGSFTATTGAISGGHATGTDVLINGGTETVSIGSSITSSAGGSIDIGSHGTNNVTLSGVINISGGTGISVHNNSGGTIAFTNASKTVSTGANHAVDLDTNTGATINFTGGGLVITTTTGAGFEASGGGTISVQGSSNTITSGAATALNLNGVTVGGSHATFQSISSNGGSAAGIIVQNTTGSPGTLFITGTGSAGSGGTIATKSGANIWSFSGGVPSLNGTTVGVGVYLNSATAISLASMQLNDFSNAAISSFASSGFSMTNTVVSGANGDDTAQDESSLFFHNPSGTASITGGSVSGGFEDNLHILKQGGAALNQFTVSGGTVFGFNNTTNGNNNILVEAQNAGTVLNFTLQGATIRGARADWINASANSSSTMNIVIGGSTAALGNTFDNLGANAHPGAAAGGNRVVLGSVGTMTFDINNNILKGSKGEGIRVRSTATGALTGNAVGNVRNNTIGVQGTANSGSSEGSGIFLFGDGGSDMTVLIDNNDIFQYNNHGISLTFGDEINDGSSFNVTVRDNTVNTPGTINTDFNGIHLNNGTVGATDNFTTTFHMTGNDIDGAGKGTISPNNLDFRLRQRQSTTVILPGYGGANNNDAAVVAFIQGQNSPSGTPSGAASNTVPTGGGFINGPVPPLPLLFAPSLPELPADEGTTPVAQPPAITPSVVEPPVVAQPPGIVDDGILSQAELSVLVGAAIARWEATGLTAEQSGLLKSVTFSIEDLPGWYLGAAGAGHVALDVNAAGNSWFVDPTPEEDSEFELTANGRLVARNATEGVPYSAAGRVDALTTVMHELGHHLGLEDSYVRTDSGNLMYGFIHLSERRLPAAGQAEGAVPHLAGSGVEYVNVPVTIGSLPIGKSVQIVFTATINLNNTAATITNQGSAFSDQGGAAGTPASPILSNTTTITVDFPDVTVALAAPTSVAEDSAGNLVYTFTREAPLTNPLTANFAVSGGAVFTGDATTDYTQTGAATFGATSGTVTFAAGSATATVTITPMADIAVEPDETVVLTVASGAGYDVGVPSAATGTILNDDTSVSVAVSPASVNEDGTTNLVYTFTRAGVTTNSLTVNFSATGTASATSDYGLTADTFIPGTGLGTVVFAANVTTATATVDPTADNDVEGDETAVLTVLAGTGYNVGAPSAATGTITNDDATVTVTVSPSSVAEDGVATLVYTFTRSGFTAGTLSVSYQASGTAIGFGAGTIDYTVTGGGAGSSFSGGAAGTGAGVMIFDAGDLQETVVVGPTDDVTGEPDETVTFTINANGTPATTGGYTVGAPGAATATILNDDTAVSVAVSPASVDEDSAAGTMVYTFTRTGDTTNALTVNFTVGGGAAFTADASTDYSQTGAATFDATTGTVVIGAGSATATVTVDPQADSTVEPDETVIFTVAAGAGYVPGAPAAATGTILNDDTSVKVELLGASTVNEDGTTNLVYTFTRSGVTTNSLTVNFSATGTASAASDYGLTADTFDSGTGLGTVVFAANVTTVTATLDPTADNDVEGDESAVLTVLAGTGYNVGTPSAATGTITNDDATVTVTVLPSSVAEDGAGTLVYTFTRSGFTSGTLSVSYQASGTATGFGAGTIDYDVTGGGAGSTFDGGAAGTGAGVLIFDAGDLTEQVVVDPIDDVTAEGDETIVFSLNANGAPATTGGYTVGAPGAATGTILEDDVNVSVAVSPTSVDEDSPAGTMVYTFTRNGDTTNPLTVNFTVGGTAVFTVDASTDYTQSGAATFDATTGTVVIAAGSATATVTLDPQADSAVEPDETAILTVVAGSGYAPGVPAAATGTILNDDTSVTVDVSPASVNEDGTTNLVYTFTRSGVTTNTLTVNFSATGSASAASDYGLTADTFDSGTGLGTVVFAANVTTATATIDPTADNAVEGDETAVLTVLAGTGYNIGSPNAATGTITNDDATVTVTVSPAATPEDGAGTLVYTFTRSGFTSGTLSVSYQASGTATGFGAGTIDYDVTGGGAGSSFDGGAAGTGAGVLIFDAGDLTEQVVVDPIDDLDGEQDETVIFTINANGAPATTGGYAVGAPGAATGTISNDDTAVSVSVSPTPVPETGVTSMIYTFTRTGANSQPLTINFSAGGAASFTNDYSITGADSFSTVTGLGTATFAAGSSTAAITLTPTNDTRVEGSETAAIAVESGAGYGVGTSPAVGTITDNDTATISFAAATSNAPEGTTPHSVGVSLLITSNGVAGTGTLERDVSVNVQDLLSGSATAGGVDYTFTTPTTVTFFSGDASSSKNVTLAIVNDTSSEGSETINLQLNTLSDGTGGQASIGAGTSHIVTIVDNDVDLTITKTDGQTDAVPGTQVVYTIVVTNAGQVTASGASVVDTFSPLFFTNVTFQASTTGGATGFTASGSGNINDTVTMPVGSQITYVVTATISASATGVLSNQATVSGPAGLTEATPGNNTATDNDTLTPRADLVVVKLGAASVAADSNLTYTITVTNNGPSDAQTVSLSDALPAGTTFISETHPGGFVATTPPVNTNGTVSYVGATLASGAVATFTITVHTDAGLAQGAQLSNTATASAATNDPIAGNNDSTLVTTVNNLDFGDAPASYQTLLVGDGARHRLGSGLFLGASIDAEVDGQPNAAATGDDNSGIDDENGVTLPGTIVAGLGATATVVASAAGKLDAWVDFNGNGVFDASEQIATNLSLVAGSNSVTFTVPVTAVGGLSFARFRLSSAGGLSPTGQATDGEVEDYGVQIAALVPGSASIIADPQNPGQFVLQVVGTSQGEVLIIEPRPSNRTQIRVRQSGTVLGIFPSSAFQRIVAFGLGGNDTIIVDSRIAKSAELHGNDGNDTLRGGSRNDVLFGENGNDNLFGSGGHDTLFGGQGNDNLFGGTGSDRIHGEAGNDSLFGDSGNDLLLGGADNDKLNGGTGRDVLIGGLGQDRLFGQTQDDILIGGTTSHDNNDAALNSILAEWTSSHGFSTRIANLGGLLNSGTVQDDGRRDTLDGDGGRDWFLDFLLADTINGFSSHPTQGDKKN